MKNILILSLFFMSCSGDIDKKCREIFSIKTTDPKICYLSSVYNYHGKCVQDFKLLGGKSEYGHSFLLEDTLRIFKEDDDGVYVIPKKADSLLKNVPLINKRTKLPNNWQKFYDFKLNDTIFRVAFDAEIMGIKNSQIYLVTLIGEKSGLQGIYIHDKSDYIIEKYKMSIIRSMMGNVYLNNIDTTKIKISYRKSTGVYL